MPILSMAELSDEGVDHIIEIPQSCGYIEDTHTHTHTHTHWPSVSLLGKKGIYFVNLYVPTETAPQSSLEPRFARPA